MNTLKKNRLEELDLEILGIFKIKAKNFTPGTKKFIIIILVLFIAIILVVALCWPKESSFIIVTKTLWKLRT